MKALVLSGGGARGAYQVGVLKTIAEVCETEHIPHPFQIYNGVSAGAINATKVCSYKNHFSESVRELEKLWSKISSDQVFLTDPGALGKIGMHLVGKLSLGGIIGTEEEQSLLDTSPLRKLIERHMDFAGLERNIHEGHIHALAISALNYANYELISFVHSADENIPQWEKPRKRSERCAIRTEHILASSSIPLLFPAQKVDHRYFGDGCLRNSSPSSPAIYLGAKRMILIGVRAAVSQAHERAQSRVQAPSTARVINAILNAVLLDSVDYDIERIERINALVDNASPAVKRNLPYHKVPLLAIQPSGDMGELAIQMAKKMPRMIRYLIKGLGPIEDAGELLSYLLFEKEYCQALIEMGYYDAQLKKDEIRRFLIDPNWE